MESGVVKEVEAGAAIAPVTKSIRVRASQARAFEVFTAGFDSWWPRTHHVGTSPMTKAVLEGRVGGLCYSEQEGGSICPWGEILVWEPPARFVMAWKLTPAWQYEPDLARCSECEVRFTPCDDGSTYVELEHRHFERHGDGGESMRNQVDQPGGWSDLLALYAAVADGAKTEEAR